MNRKMSIKLCYYLLTRYSECEKLDIVETCNETWQRIIRESMRTKNQTVGQVNGNSCNKLIRSIKYLPTFQYLDGVCELLFATITLNILLVLHLTCSSTTPTFTNIYLLPTTSSLLLLFDASVVHYGIPCLVEASVLS